MSRQWVPDGNPGAFVEELSSGYIRVSWPPSSAFAQFPSDFSGETIPDEYIFEPDWNRNLVNNWWAKQREGKPC